MSRLCGMGVFAAGQNPGCLETAGVLLAVQTSSDCAPPSLSLGGVHTSPAQTRSSSPHLVLQTILPNLSFLVWAFLSLSLQTGRALGACCAVPLLTVGSPCPRVLPA